MKVFSYKNLIMRFFFCATGSRLYVMSTGAWHFLLVNYLDLILRILIACPLRLYCIGCLHPQLYFYAWYLMHHSHLHSELVHSLFYTVLDLFSFHWNGIFQYHHSYRLVWHPYLKNLTMLESFWNVSLYPTTRVLISWLIQ